VSAALLALALAAQAGDPCVQTDARGRAFLACFDPGNRLELTIGGVGGGRVPFAGGALDLGAALRRRRDVRSHAGRVEWLVDHAFAELRGLFTTGDVEARAAEGLAWRGTFVRHRESPFVLVPGPRPIRLPFPFDVGLRVEVGGAAWDGARPDDVALAPIRSALLLDLGGGRVLRRLAFGPEVAWGVRVREGEETVHELVPFSAGVVDARAESRDGLHLLAVVVRGGSAIALPGGAEGFVEARLTVERIVLAVNDRPVALYASASARGGGAGRGGEVGGGLRVGLRR
jgi:hypothetical protein